MCSAVYTDVHMDILMDSSSTYIGIFYCAGNGKYMYKKPTFQGKLSTICSIDSKPQSFNSTKPWKRTHTKYRFFKHLNDEMKNSYSYLLSNLRYDPCRPTSTFSRRWPYKIPVHTLYSTVHCVSYLAGINSCNEPRQIISNWSLVLQYTFIVVRGITGIKPEALIAYMYITYF